MMREFGEMIIQRGGVDRLDGVPRMLMQLLATLEQHRVVSHLLRERVLEDIFDVGDRGLLVNELAKLQSRDQAFQLVLGFARHGARQTENEFAAEDRERLQQVLLVIVQPVDAGGENGLHGRRNS